MSNYATDPANVYFNANYINETRDTVNAEFNSYRNTVIVNSPGEYYLKIENFEISDLLLPLMTIGATSLSITIDATSSGGIVFKQYLPVINNSTSGNSGRIYNIDIFVEMMNEALNLAHIGSGALGNKPQYVYNGDGTFTFIIDQTYGDASMGSFTEIWFNNLLGQKLSSFTLFFNSFSNDYPPVNDGKVFRLTYYPTPNNQFTQYPSVTTGVLNPLVYNLYKITQPYASTYLLSDITRLVITTTQMPTLREFITGLPGQNITVTLGVLFSIPLSGNFQSNSERISYRPANNRYIDLPSQEPLNIVDYKIYYQTIDGVIHPIRIEPGKGFGITFVFVHRSIVDNAYTFNKLDIKY